MNDRLDSVSKGTGDFEDGTEIVAKNEYSYENDRIKTITHNGFNYVFDYDEFGNTKTVYAGDRKLIDNNYEVKDVIGKDSLPYKVNTGKLLSSSYGNNSTISWDYDNLDRVKTQKYGNEERYKFEYDGSGNLGYHEDLVNGVNYRYFYDFVDRLARISGSNDTSASFEYDLNNNLSKLTDIIKNDIFTTGYFYDGDNKNTDVVIDSSSNKKIKYEFDSIGRIKSVKIINGKNADDTDIIAGTYMTYNYNSRGRIESITYSDGSTISYTYDKNGNIETITQGIGMVKYSYNNLNELKDEEYYSSGKLVKKLSYSYDAGGNIKTKTTVAYSENGEAGSPDVISYLYKDTKAWKDLLTSYNGQELTYDEIGNVISYAGYAYTWEGRELKSILGNGLNLSFKYNSDGIRTEKADGNSITKYYFVGDKITYQETIDTSSNTITDKMYFIYDAAGKLVSMKLDGIRYDYIRNAQGDITGLMDMTGNKVVSYSYDSWGKLESIDGSLKDSLGVKNPYRYRGYRYDNETGLYYLQSRYYSPEWGRFINADGIIGATGELLGHNLHTYCRNNPVNGKDSAGFRPVFDDEETQRQYDQWVRTQRPVSKVAQSNSSSSFNYASSAVKGTKSGVIDKVGEVIGGTFIKEKKVWQSLWTLTLGKYVSSFGRGAKFSKKALGIAGTAGFAIWDVVNDLKQGEYYSATIDIASAICGFAAGAAIGAFVGAFAVPAGVAGLLVFGFSVGAGVAIEKYATYKKDLHYGR